MTFDDTLKADSPWDIHEERYDSEQGVNSASNFMTGNGYLGYRGTLPDDGSKDFVACVLTDTYDMADGVWRELCTVPNPLFVELKIDGRRVPWAVDNPDESGRYRRGLSMRDGRWSLRREISDAGVTLEAERFAGCHEIHGLFSRIRVEVDENRDAPVAMELRAGIDTEIWSLNGRHFGPIAVREEDGLLLATAQTGERGVPVAVAARHVVGGTAVLETETAIGDDGAFHVYTAAPAPGGEIVLDIFAGIYGGNDLRWERERNARYRIEVGEEEGERIEPPEDAESGAVSTALRLSKDRYEDHVIRQREAWGRLWERFDIRIDGDEAAQTVLRFNTYHSVIATPMHTDHLPIGARGLSCQAYQGAAFWDQEIFNMPMFLHTAPTIARNILTYRHRTIEGARKKARDLGYRGAFYAWVSGDTGEEICPSYFFKDVLSGRKIRNHFNDWQIHISPDISYAVNRYVHATGDTEFLVNRGAEIVFEVARFIVSRCHLRPDTGTYEILRVLGPDEYHENVDNNAFTNRQARFAANYALEVLEILANQDSGALEKLRDKLELRDDEVALWRDFVDRVKLAEPDPQSGVIEAFDGFFDLEDTTPKTLRERLIDPGEYWGWPNGIAVETQVSKQADVIQLLALHPDLVSPEALRANWEYYEPRTQHGSSLSPAVYGMTAAWTGHMGEAFDYFWKAALIDLKNTNRAVSGGTFIGGIHTAACGALWQVVTMGFAGMRPIDGGYAFDPHLPPDWREVAFPLVYHGRRIRVRVKADSLEVSADAGNDGPVRIVVPSESRDLPAGAEEQWKVRA